MDTVNALYIHFEDSCAFLSCEYNILVNARTFHEVFVSWKQFKPINLNKLLYVKEFAQHAMSFLLLREFRYQSHSHYTLLKTRAGVLYQIKNDVSLFCNYKWIISSFMIAIRQGPDFEKNVIVAGQPVTITVTITWESGSTDQSDCKKCYSHFKIYTKN